MRVFTLLAGYFHLHFLTAICTARIAAQFAAYVKFNYGIVKGERIIAGSGEEFLAFQNIRYAQAPTGDGRFKYPESFRGPHAVQDIESMHPCSQIDRKTMKYIGSEDCLFLHVYTPKINCSGPCNFEVIFHIPGGDFTTSNDASRTIGLRQFPLKDVVFVTISYRVGPFGFLSTDDFRAPGNYGLLDQLQALRWVWQNIDKFGGDYSKITLLGQGAGAASVIYHVLSPLSVGLFHRAIAMSGSALCPWALQDTPLYWAKKLAKDLLCPTDSNEALVQCLRTIPAEDLAVKGSYQSNGILLPIFAPTVDNNFIDRLPLNTLTNNIQEGRDIPIIIGTTKNEINCALSSMDNEVYSDDDIYAILQLAVGFRPNISEAIKAVTEIYSINGNEKGNGKQLLQVGFNALVAILGNLSVREEHAEPYSNSKTAKLRGVWIRTAISSYP